MKGLIKFFAAVISAVLLFTVTAAASEAENLQFVGAAEEVENPTDECGVIADLASDLSGEDVLTDELQGGHGEAEESQKDAASKDALADDLQGGHGEAEESQKDAASKDALADAKGVNLFAVAFEAVKENLGQILSALSFAASLLIALAYKRGLSPMLNRTAERIGGAVEKLRTESEKERSESMQIAQSNEEALLRAEEQANELREKISDILVRLGTVEEQKALAERVERTVAQQIDMLYEIFMSSGIPQYEKDAMGERVAKMKKEIGAYEE